MTEPILDYVALPLPEELDLDVGIDAYLAGLAEGSVFAQYRGRRPRAILLEPVDWLITGDPHAVERFQPAHDCEECRACNADAVRFLEANPGRRLALGNLRYIEVW